MEKRKKRILTEEHKRKLSISLKGKNTWIKGRKLSKDHKYKIGISHLGKPRSEETRHKISESLMGVIHSKETREKIKISMLGRKSSQATIEKMRKSMNKAMSEGRLRTLFKKGHTPWNYIDGRSYYYSPTRYGNYWEKIRILIWRRDKYECQNCGMNMDECYRKFKCTLHVHHIIPLLTSFDNSLNNLITLCPSCHKKEDMRLIKEFKVQNFGGIFNGK